MSEVIICARRGIYRIFNFFKGIKIFIVKHKKTIDNRYSFWYNELERWLMNMKLLFLKKEEVHIGNPEEYMGKIQKNAIIFEKIWAISAVLLVISLCMSVSNVISLWNTAEESFLIGASIQENLLETQGSYLSLTNDNTLDVSFLGEKSQVKTAIIVWQTLTCFALPFAFLTLLGLKRILDAILCGEPFQSGVSRHIRTIAWGIVGLQLFLAAMHSIATWICKLLIPDFYRGPLFLLEPELLFTWFLLHTLAAVFAYGEALQQQADDTI